MDPSMKTVSIRTSLLRNFVPLILVLSITILLVTIAGARWAVRDVTGRLIEQSADLAEDAMGDFFGSIEELVSASRAWWNEGLIDYQDRKNEKYAKGYKITAPTLVLADVHGDKVTAWKPCFRTFASTLLRRSPPISSTKPRLSSYSSVNLISWFNTTILIA